MVVYEKMFNGKPVLLSSKVTFSIFRHTKVFQNHLNFQGLQPFLRMKLPYYENLVRVFYTNLKFTTIGDLFIEINSKRIEIRQMDWMNKKNLKYDGVKLILVSSLKEYILIE